MTCPATSIPGSARRPDHRPRRCTEPSPDVRRLSCRPRRRRRASPFSTGIRGRIGHVQIAAVPSRAEPDEGTLDYRAVFNRLEAIGYEGGSVANTARVQRPTTDWRG